MFFFRLHIYAHALGLNFHQGILSRVHLPSVSFKVRQHLSGVWTPAQLPFFDKIKYANCNIYFNLISLDSQIKILFNDINHYLATNQKTLCQTCEHKKDFILSVNICYSFFNKNE